MNTLVFFISLLLGILLPIIVKKEIKKEFNLKEILTICLGNTIFTILLSLLICHINNYSKDLISILSGSILANIYSYFILKNEINLKKMPKSLLVIFTFLLSSLFGEIFCLILNWNIETLSPLKEGLIMLIQQLTVLGIFTGLYYKELKKDAKEFKKKHKFIFDEAFKYWFTGLVVMLVSNYIIMYGLGNAQPGNETAIRSMVSAMPFASLISAGILAPILEEITFRKAFKDVLENKWLFIMTSALIFGGLHVIGNITNPLDLLYIIPYSSLGVAFGYTYYKTNNIFGTITIHIMHNTFLILIQILTLGVIL